MSAENNKIDKVVKDGLINPGFDLAQDYAELDLDAFIDNPAIKEIPIVKTVVGLVKGGIAIREIFLAKKLLTFLREYHMGKLSTEKKQAFISKFNSEPKYRESVVEQIMMLNDRFISIEKSKILANLFQAHINGKCSWELFCNLAECVDDLNTIAFKILANSAEAEGKDRFHFSTSEPEKDGGGILFSGGICTIHGNHYSINGYGQYIYFYGIKGDIDFSFPVPEREI